MKIAILGTRGIPNRYGGFEQFAEKLSVALVQKGHSVAVYSPHYHVYNKDEYQGVQIIRKKHREKIIGAAANFFYDYRCLKDAIRKEFDIVLECGYGTSVVSYFLCNIQKTIVVTNMDGLEWKREKWGFLAKTHIKWAEKKAIKKSHAVVSDSEEIQKHLVWTYGVKSHYIPYGADVIKINQEEILKKYNLQSHSYYLVVSRIEEENNLHLILDGYEKSQVKCPMIVVGDCNNRYARKLKRRYGRNRNILFLKSVFDQKELHNLRYFSKIYFHGHSVGGTNPSLLDAMASEAFVIAHQNKFNRAVLQDDAKYFSSSDDVKMILENFENYNANRKVYLNNNLNKVKVIYNWDKITEQYQELFLDLIEKKEV